MIRIIPMRHKDANEYVRKWHRHNKPTLGAIFCVGVANDDVVCGVAIVGHPIARMLDDGETLEILRIATDGTRNACSALYGACRRIGKEMGYRKTITYTLPEEGGASLKASGYRFDGDAGAPAKGWHSRKFHRHDVEPIGTDLVGGKWRWVA